MGLYVQKLQTQVYMVDKLHLSLARYAIMWNLDRLEDRIDKLQKIEEPKDIELHHLLQDLLLAYFSYVRSLRLYL